jgi:hypothetical protein
MSVANELSGDVAVAFFKGRDEEKPENILGVILEFQSALRELSKEERTRHHARLFRKEFQLVTALSSARRARAGN